MSEQEIDQPVADVVETDCVVVGGGPGGMIAAYLLARQGVRVILLESHKDFDRLFRGDTVHPTTMELFDSLGLADGLLAIPHTKLHKLILASPDRVVEAADFSHLHTKFPYIALIPQVKLLDFLAEESKKLPTLEIRMQANVKSLVEEGGVYRGVRYQGPDGWHEIRAQAVIAADGRSSPIRKRLGLEPIASAPPMDILWMIVPRKSDDPPCEEKTFRVSPGQMTVVLNRDDTWQIAFMVPKGGFHDVKEKGLEYLRGALRAIVPEIADRFDHIQEWKQIIPLAVESNRLPRWHLPGILLIGDAAHTMSPVGGVGINYAVQDAIEVGNLLAEPLKNGTLTEDHLAAVQKRREGPVRFIQTVQSILQRRIIANALDTSKPFAVPFLMRVPFVDRILGFVIAYGVHSSHWKDARHKTVKT